MNSERRGDVSVGESILEAQNLEVSFVLPGRTIHAVRRVSFDLRAGEILAIVGESGCGKTTTCLSILQLLPLEIARITDGRIWFHGADLLALSESDLCAIRGRRMGIIYQDPLTAFNPSMTIGDQIIEAIREHEHIGKREAFDRARTLLERVGIPTAARRMSSYPHEFSGGMRQRAAIAMALACRPEILIADEPTSALDVTTQAQILELLKELQAEFGLSVILVTHDLGIVANIAQRVLIMYAGESVERGQINDIFYDPRHPYTQGLLRCVVHPALQRNGSLDAIPGYPPSLDDPPQACSFVPRCPFAEQTCSQAAPAMDQVSQDHQVACYVKPYVSPTHRSKLEPTVPSVANSQVSPAVPELTASLQNVNRPAKQQALLAAHNLHCAFPARGPGSQRQSLVHAVNGVSFSIMQGETLGLVGESGCGKSTLARVLLQLIRADRGQVFFEGQDIVALPRSELQEIRRHIQIIFQDPYSSLNPKLSVARILSEPFLNYGLRPSREELHQLLYTVGLGPDMLRRRPGQLSGGQQQRVVTARALALEPKLLVCDEPTSALDASVRAQILNLFVDLQGRLGISYLFISHDLNVVSYMSDRVAVMYLGYIVEVADSGELYTNPRHPYTQALLSALPVPDPEIERRRTRILLKGDPPDPVNIPSGCPFHTRCPIAEFPLCSEEVPKLKEIENGDWVACHLV